MGATAKRICGYIKKKIITCFSWQCVLRVRLDWLIF